MQEGAQVPQWLQLTSSILAGILSGIGIDKLYNSWLNRKKPTAELHVTEERATEIRLRSHSTATDIVVKMMDRLDTAQVTIDRLRAERDAWEEQYGEVFTDRARVQRENDRLQGENEGYEIQIKRMQRTLAENGFNYDNTQNTPVGPVSETKS